MSPEVTVVTSVYNGADILRASMMTVLQQTGVDFDVIAVNDGSEDGSGELLDDMARQDNRLRVIHQANQGLTRSLIHGCAAARGAFIARHDADDNSLPGRLQSQSQRLREDPQLAFVSCWSRSIGPANELLFENFTTECNNEMMTKSLLQDSLGIAGHGTVMFRKTNYIRAGEYRPSFQFCQDWDLWLRLAEQGKFNVVPKYLYEYRIRDNSISAHRRQQQTALHALTKQCQTARQRGTSEDPLLAEAQRVSQDLTKSRTGGDTSNSYFIGSALARRGDGRSKKYLRRAWLAEPLNLRRLMMLIFAYFRCRSRD